MKQLITFLLFFLIIFLSNAQEKKILLLGRITSDTLSVENIHILNKTSHKGTISNKHGEFKIPVALNDTLLFSGLQFYHKEISISKQQYINKTILIKLYQKVNKLDEIAVKSHNLSGNLAIDSRQTKKSTSKVDGGALDFSMIDFGEIVLLDTDNINKIEPPNASKLTNPNILVGGNILGLLTLIKGKKGRQRRLRKKEEKLYQKNIQNARERIILEFGKPFFTQTLKIPLKEITPFINYCKKKDIIDLYLKNRKMEVLNILIKESNAYLEQSKHKN